MSGGAKKREQRRGARSKKLHRGAKKREQWRGDRTVKGGCSTLSTLPLGGMGWVFPSWEGWGGFELLIY
jgi:hypothetical protein